MPSHDRTRLSASYRIPEAVCGVKTRRQLTGSINVVLDATVNDLRMAGLPGAARLALCPVSFVLRQSRTREASVSLPQIDETDVPLTCSDSGSASLTCLMISRTIDAPGCLTYLRHRRSAPRSCLIFS